jgi:tol-pal system protein YbgF|tara:strand:- start:16483 stop:17271 length:789 start_codon:yes stop_codon:yes gene_type:complete
MSVCRYIVVFLAIFSMPVIAVAPVSEIGKKLGATIRGSTTTNSSIDLSANSQSLQYDPHYQGQLLKEEVKALRGMVEELRNEVERLLIRQTENYLDLDRRLSEQTNKPASSRSVTAGKSLDILSGQVKNKAQPVILPLSEEKESDHYNEAYAHLRSGDINQAISKFKVHISVYPKGEYIANVYYWLGEIYLLQSELDLARQSFAVIHKDYPAHGKYLDAKFKLGQVYFMLGDTVKAKKLLESVASSDSNAALLARRYLDENF